MRIILKAMNKDLLDEFYNLTVCDEVVDYYKRRVKGNESKSNVTLINKLRRNFVVGKFEYTKEGLVVKSYGNLYIMANKNEITGIQNRKGDFTFCCDEKKKKILDKIFKL